ncbi:MAG: uracil-DNA glycosylase [Myxococcota bacterium]
MDPELVGEFTDLTRALRAQLEWAQHSGTTGLPHLPLAAEAAPEPVAAPLATAFEAQPLGAVPGQVLPSAGVLPGAGVLPSAAALPSAPIVVPVDPEARRARLSVLADEARACTRCGLHRERTQAVFARGTGSVGVCFVGEGPGADEDAQGYPFVGAAGQLLDKMIAAMGFQRDEVYVCNIVKCRPPKNRKPEPDEMAACRPFLEEQIELIQPQVMVALGATAVQGLLGTSEGITRLRGKWKLYKGRIPVMPTFHPAYLLRTPGAKREVWEDLQAVLRQMGRALPERRR